MQGLTFPREINFVKVGAVAAFLLAAMVLTFYSSYPGALSDVTPRTETGEFLDDVVDEKNYPIALAWLGASLALVIVTVFLGLYYGLRRWSEGNMRVAALFGVVAALFIALANAPLAAFAAYIIPAWADASDKASQSIVLSDAKTLLWVADSMFGLFTIALAIAVIAASLVMLRLGRLWWTVVGWIGIVGGVAGIFRPFALAAGDLGWGSLIIHGMATFFWLLGVGVGLWRLPVAEASAG